MYIKCIYMHVHENKTVCDPREKMRNPMYISVCVCVCNFVSSVFVFVFFLTCRRVAHSVVTTTVTSAETEGEGESGQQATATHPRGGTKRDASERGCW